MTQKNLDASVYVRPECEFTTLAGLSALCTSPTFDIEGWTEDDSDNLGC